MSKFKTYLIKGNLIQYLESSFVDSVSEEHAIKKYIRGFEEGERTTVEEEFEIVSVNEICEN